MPHRRSSEQAAICRAIVAGDADAAFAAHGVSLVDQAAYRRMADDIVAATVARHQSFRRYDRARIRNPIRLVLALSTAFGVVPLVAAAALSRWIDLADKDSYPILGSVVACAAIGVAAIGWGVSGWIAHRNNRSKYTLDVVAARYAQTAFSDALADLNQQFKGLAIDEALVAAFANSDDANRRRAAQGLRYLVNYCEFIAVGVLEGELDEAIVAKTLRGNLTFIYDRSARWIIELQRRNPRTLQHFSTLRRHYQEV